MALIVIRIRIRLHTRLLAEKIERPLSDRFPTIAPHNGVFGHDPKRSSLGVIAYFQDMRNIA